MVVGLGRGMMGMKGDRGMDYRRGVIDRDGELAKGELRIELR
jgi:hypothetical protein